MNLLDSIKRIFENQLQIPVISIHPFSNVPNNKVYRIETGKRPFIFKIYSSSWPEDGKLLFVERILEEHRIPHAKIFAYSRDTVDFPHGYLIEECLPGTTADRLALTKAETIALFEKLVPMVSRIHQIQISGCGYLGTGTAGWTTSSEFICDSLYDNIATLKEYDLISESELLSVERELRKRLECCDLCPSVLIHGDLSLKNVIVSGGTITLIDWDDSYSLCWIADIAYLTLWMKRTYGKDAGIYREVFLNNYETWQDKNLFYETEDIFHVRYGLDNLNFFISNSNYRRSIDVTKAVLRESFTKCRMKMLKCLL